MRLWHVYKVLKLSYLWRHKLCKKQRVWACVGRDKEMERDRERETETELLASFKKRTVWVFLVQAGMNWICSSCEICLVWLIVRIMCQKWRCGSLTLLFSSLSSSSASFSSRSHQSCIFVQCCLMITIPMIPKGTKCQPMSLMFCGDHVTHNSCNLNKDFWTKDAM